MMSRLPRVGIPCDYRVLGHHPFHMAGDKYITALRDGAGLLPLLIPVLTPALPPADILSSVDALFFTGSLSNVSPSRYGGPGPRDGTLQDEARDATTLALLPAAIEAGVPVFCVCRGFQELNVAMGGTLHQHVEEVAGLSDHRAAHGAPLAVQYGPAHPMRVVPGGVLSRLLDEQEFFVNSLHSQGIERLAPPLRPEAVAPDGLIEAVSLPTAKAFLLGVQWHPEWLWAENPVSRAIYAAFGAAARTFSQTRNA